MLAQQECAVPSAGRMRPVSAPAESGKIIDAAIALLAAGFSVIPTSLDKRPLVPWKEFQARRMTEAEARQHFTNGARLAVVCGGVSGNLEALDFDDPTTYEPFSQLLADLAPGLPDRLTVRRKTPSGGYHVIYRCAAPVKGNLKLARLAEKNQAGEDCRIETRGEGGYILAAPSPGYEILSGRLIDCPTLTPAEVNALHRAARMFDQKLEPAKTTTTRTAEGTTPGDQFNEAHSAEDILTPHGWKPDRPTTAGQGFTRPGKKSGIGGVMLENGNFYCWSSNAGPLEPGQSYSPFALYAAYEHNGDFSAAARELAREGYGKRTADQGAPKKNRLTFTLASELTGMQAPTIWLVKPYIEAVTFSCLFAPPESLKTFVVIDLGLCTATGKEWHGQKVKSGPVLYLCGEARRNIGRRIAAWEKQHKVKADKFFVSSGSAALLDPMGIAELEAAADEVAAEHGNPVLLIIDTLNRNFGPGDENSTTDMTAFIAALDRLRDRLQCAILIVHHTGLADAGRGRGNSALRGALDFEFCITPKHGATIEDAIIELSCSKCKDHDRPPTMAFRPVVVDLGMVDEDMRPITSLTLERTEYTPQPKQERGLPPQQRIALEALKETTRDKHRAHLEDWREAAYRKGIADSPEAKRKAFKRARTALVVSGLVEAENDLYAIPGQSGTLAGHVPECHGELAGQAGHIPLGMSRMSRSRSSVTVEI